ncbi:putative 2-carboxy-D-arabinitol-1-phosphatase, partial [Ananas comosus]
MGGASLVAAAAPPPPGILAIRNLKPLGVRRLFSFSCSNSYPPNCSGKQRNLITLVHCSINNVSTEIINNVSTESPPESEVSMTGAAYDFKGATTSLTNELLSSAKKVTLVRHGLSSWNEESRVQGSSDLSILTETGAMQAERCRNALINMNFDICFSSPISRAKVWTLSLNFEPENLPLFSFPSLEEIRHKLSTAELIWHGREQPLIFLDSLKEAHLFFLEGMTNADAKKKYPELYTKWREDPANFHVEGVYPIRRLWGTAREAWKEILFSPGESFLVVTHKSILRALICTALGLGPERFRSIDVNNGGISTFTINKRGEAMLQSLNMTAHMYSN